MWNYVNEAVLGLGFCARLAWRRRQSIRMVGHFEWPRRCRGWQRRRVRRLLLVASFLVAAFDGCTVGVTAAPGVLALKPWAIATSRPAVHAAFHGRLCDGTHKHGVLR